jgi:hypothetical protein
MGILPTAEIVDGLVELGGGRLPFRQRWASSLGGPFLLAWFRAWLIPARGPMLGVRCDQIDHFLGTRLVAQLLQPFDRVGQNLLKRLGVPPVHRHDLEHPLAVLLCDGRMLARCCQTLPLLRALGGLGPTVANVPTGEAS